MIKDREAILANRWLKRFAHLFAHPTLWHLNRRSVPRALAIGFFAAFIIPLGQFALAALVAVAMRANVPLAAASTLISNPLTFPPIYFAAYKVGFLLLPVSSAEGVGEVAQSLGSTLLDVSGPVAVGLLVFAVVSAVLGYVAGAIWWRISLVRRWRRRRPKVLRDTVAVKLE
ncbi:MAG: DUF2062 domain-containing protein [Rhodomicrobiaceae bacterium]